MQTLQPALQGANGKQDKSRNYGFQMVPENSLEVIQPQAKADRTAALQNVNDAFFAKRRNMRSSMSYMANQMQEQEERAQS